MPVNSLEIREEILSTIIILAFIWGTLFMALNWSEELKILRKEIFFNTSIPSLWLAISLILSGLKLPVVSMKMIVSPGKISLAQFTQRLKQSCDFPVPLSPKKSVTKPDRIPPPSKLSNDAEPVLIIIVKLLRCTME